MVLLSSCDLGPRNYFIVFKYWVIVATFQKFFTDSFVKSNFFQLLCGINRSRSPEVFLGKGIRKICSKFTGETPMLKCDFNKFANQLYWNHTRHGCSPVNLLHIFRTPFPKNISGWLIMNKFSQRFHKILTEKPPEGVMFW